MKTPKRSEVRGAGVLLLLENGFGIKQCPFTKNVNFSILNGVHYVFCGARSAQFALKR